MLPYGMLFYSLMAWMMLWKTLIIPMVIGVLLPYSDAGASFMELSALAFGTLTLGCHVYLGFVGRKRFGFTFFQQCHVYALCQSPFLLYALLDNAVVELSLQNGWVLFAKEWLDLMSEPARLLSMMHPWENVVTLGLGLIMMLCGRWVEIQDDEKAEDQKRGELS